MNKNRIWSSATLLRNRQGNGSRQKNKHMLNIASWDYIAGVSVCLMGYYLIIIAIYYKEEVREFMNSRSLISRESTEREEVIPGYDQLDALEEKVNTINIILKNTGSNANKEELLEKISEVLAGFNGSTIPAWRVAIYKHIINEAGTQCGVTISEEELDRRG